MNSNHQTRLEGLATILAPIGWSLLGLAILGLIAFKTETFQLPPTLLAAGFIGALVCLSGRLALVVWSLARHRRAWGRGLAEAVVIGGLLLALTSGTANWAFGLQGAVILIERETVRLHGGSQLQEFDVGPLAQLEEMGYLLGLEELEFVSDDSDGFYPVSRIQVAREDADPQRFDISPHASAAVGTLRLHQGAFGFAPRLVILKGERSLFDQVVPFLTRRVGGPNLSYEGQFIVEAEGLAISGIVNLASLDEAMRGHAFLELTVLKDGEPIGQGSLLPGHFADLDDEYRIGFAGLDRWSEIDISRRNYSQLMYLGMVLCAPGLVFWPLAAWRRW